MSGKVTYLSPEGFEREQQKLISMNERLAAIRTDKSEAYTMTGDNWHDNPNWNRLEQDEARALEEIGVHGNMLSKSQIFTAPETRNTDKIALGSIVHLERKDGKTGATEELIWEIVPFGDTDLKNGKIGYNAPVAQTLMGLEVDDVAEQPGKGSTSAYTVVALYKTWEEAKHHAPKLVAQPHRPDGSSSSSQPTRKL